MNNILTYLKQISETLIKIHSILAVDVLPASPVPQNSTGERFIDNGDGTVTDLELKLMWDKNGSNESMNFKAAEKYCKEFNLADHSDWRLPTLKELESLVDYKKSTKTILEPFNTKAEWYWTSLKKAGSADSYWLVSFGYGGTGWSGQVSVGYVRPVRQY